MRAIGAFDCQDGGQRVEPFPRFLRVDVFLNIHDGDPPAFSFDSMRGARVCIAAARSKRNGIRSVYRFVEIISIFWLSSEHRWIANPCLTRQESERTHQMPA